MSNTPRFKLPEIAANQAQKHITHNTALTQIDALLHLHFEELHRTTPPEAPQEGATYLIGTPAKGSWAGQEGKIAFFFGGAWNFYESAEGVVACLSKERRFVICRERKWEDLTEWLSPKSVSGLGINTNFDATNRLAVKSNAILFSHDDQTPGTGSLHLMLNRAQSSQDAACVFQSNWSTRALLGLLANEDFTLKVSPDGRRFISALTVSSTTGKLYTNGKEILHEGNLSEKLNPSVTPSVAPSPNPPLARKLVQTHITNGMEFKNLDQFHLSGLDCTLSLSSAASCVRIVLNISFTASSTGLFFLTRNGTEIGSPPSQGKEGGGICPIPEGGERSTHLQHATFEYIDTPQKRGPVTYAVHVRLGKGKNRFFFLNRVSPQRSSSSQENGTSRMILEEIL